jgi:hypothetical protein
MLNEIHEKHNQAVGDEKKIELYDSYPCVALFRPDSFVKLQEMAMGTSSLTLSHASQISISLVVVFLLHFRIRPAMNLATESFAGTSWGEHFMAQYRWVHSLAEVPSELKRISQLYFALKPTHPSFPVPEVDDENNLKVI